MKQNLQKCGPTKPCSFKFDHLRYSVAVLEQWLTQRPREVGRKAWNPQSKHHGRQSTSLVCGASLQMVMAICALVSFLSPFTLSKDYFILRSLGRREEACLPSRSHLWKCFVISLQHPNLETFSALKNHIGSQI